MEIKTIEISEDIQTVCVVADSFPVGIKPAYEKLDRLIQKAPGRGLYGVTEIVNGNFIYRACVSKPTEGDDLSLQQYTISKGTYLYMLFEWEGHEHEIGGIFEQLMAHPNAKEGSIGVEKYYVSPTEAMLMVQASI